MYSCSFVQQRSYCHLTVQGLLVANKTEGCRIHSISATNEAATNNKVYHTWQNTKIVDVMIWSSLNMETVACPILGVHGSVNHNTNLIEMTNKMQLCRTIYYSRPLSWLSGTWLQPVPTQPSQQPATINVCKTRGCNYSFWAPNDGRCVARNLLSN
jgi:hypothetical protein